MPSIVILSGPNKGDYYPLDRGGATVGRHEECTIQVVDDLVSRKHIRLRHDSETDGFFVSDLGSSHGASIDKKKIDGETRVRDGSVITIGNSSMMFMAQDFPERESALKDTRLKRWLGEGDRMTQA